MGSCFSDYEVKPIPPLCISQKPESVKEPPPILDELGNYEDVMAPEFVYGNK